MIVRKILQKIYAIKLFRRLLPSIFKKLIKISKKNKTIIKHKDVLFQLNLNNPIDREVYLKGNYEKKQLEYLSKNIDEQNIEYFIDIGAHMGFYSINMSKKNIKIIAFEPVKNNYIQLKFNKKLNQKKNIKIYNYALSNKKKIITMWVPNKDKTGGYSVYDNDDEEIKKYHYLKLTKVKSKAIVGDSVLKMINKKLAIKIDVERHEKKVLEGLKCLFKNNNVFIQIELFDNRKNEIIQYLKLQKFSLLNNINKDYYFKNF